MKRRSLHVEIRMSSRVDLANMVHAASDALCRLAGMDEDAMLNMGLALREATVNAIKHGNASVEAKPVVITFDLTPQRLRVDVRDQGKGFRFGRRRDPRAASNLLRTDGRGLFLMKSFVDDVHYAHTPRDGTTVSLIKNLPRARRSRVREG